MASPRPPKLTFRVKSESGGVLVRPRLCPRNALTGRRYLVLLIHGFNNTQEQAEDAYGGFLALQRELGNLNPDQPVADGHIVEFYWPGDVGRWEWSRALNYEDSLNRAIEIATPLVQAFERLIQDGIEKEIDVVAHSMGCRLTLEFLRRLASVQGVTVRRVVFMAAAVPTFLLEPSERLWQGFAHPGLERVLSLYSPDDEVLDDWFSPGQWEAQGESWTEGDEWKRGRTVALGLNRWENRSIPGVLAQTPIGGADHSDYWGWKPDTRNNHGLRANTEVKNFLGLTAAGAREILLRERAGRETPPARAGGPVHDIASRSADGSEGTTCAEV